MKLKLLVLLLLYFSPLFWQGSVNNVAAQDQQIIDSLQNQLAKHNALKFKLGKNTPAMFDTTAANILYELSKANWYNNPDKAIDFANQCQKLSEQIGFKKGKGFAIYSIGVCYFQKADYPKAIEFTNKSLKSGIEIGDKKLVAASNVNLGVIKFSQNYDTEAMKNFLTALRLAEEIGDYEIAYWSSYNLAVIFAGINNYSGAVKYNLESLKAAEKTGDKNNVANCYNRLGSFYTALGNYPEALKNHFAALKTWEETGEKAGLSNCLFCIGWTYQVKGNYTEALKNHLAALKIYQEQDNQDGVARTYDNLGQIYTKQKKYKEAAEYLNKSLAISKQLGIIDNIKYTYGDLVSLDSAQGNFEMALEHYKLFIETRDSIINEEKIRKITQQQMQFEFDKKQMADSLNFVQEKEIGVVKLQKQKAFTYAGLGGLVIAIILLFFVYANYNKQRIANQKLKKAQQQLIQIEREKEAENIRLRISRDIHDDIGHSLTKISLLSDMTAGDKQINSPEAIETLGRISDYSRNVNSSLSEIVWAISPKHDSLDSLIVYMRNHIHKFFENTGITYKINFSDTYENRAINPELKRNIFLVLKESLNNILKYAQAKSVTVDFKIDGDQFELKIKDDGVGFTPLSFGEGLGVRTGGNGLLNMKHRIEQTGGSFEISSSVGSGCEILAKGKLV